MTESSNVFGYLSLMCGIISMLPPLTFLADITLPLGAISTLFIALPFGTIGILLALFQMKKSQNNLAWAGLITSIVGIALNSMVFIMFLRLFN